ncbi:hypothetical protein FoTM2_017709 [Fusarium oxysporum f. sp. vasinfectum]|uniref:Uncharacterized protein n=1 Tax=Fusarium oxysporum f. sp. vasinfectum 25433 TaxID=1089449 RepID=X0KMZ0_FUSOX|nr:hypothetical protein FOTG_16717 [Fusarium oxysporum f. sp. vasinfectum 25433]KAK2922353.1 hypothetical protein FoTM2_017709 [Fusarium oxysporum f. sp. vasinfectum]
MSSDTLISEPSMPLFLHPPLIIPYESSNADHGLDERPSYDTATTINSEIQSEDGNLGPKTTTPADNSIPSIPSRLEHHRNRMALVRQLYQNIQHQMVVPETNPIYICLQLLRPAVFLLCELQQALGVEPSNLLRESIARTGGGYKERIAIMEGMVDASFTAKIDIIGSLSLEGFADRFGVCEGYIIHDMIFGDVGLLKIMEEMRIYCHYPGHVQLLPTELRYAAATVYLDFSNVALRFVERS